MPKGALRSEANTSLRGLPAFSGRNTRTLPELLSATKISPLGAARIRRGSSSPSANRLTSNPGGTVGLWLGERCTIRTPFENEAPRSAAGRSAALMCRRRPGRSALQSVNAARPWSSPVTRSVSWATVWAGVNRPIAISREPPTAANAARRVMSFIIVTLPPLPYAIAHAGCHPNNLGWVVLDWNEEQGRLARRVTDERFGASHPHHHGRYWIRFARLFPPNSRVEEQSQLSP
jgi:hypothetical protein